MHEITPSELQERLQQPDPPLLIDVREDFERELYNIGGLHIPLGELNSRADEIQKNRILVIYCARGIRSAIAIQRLESRGFTKLINLTGGMYNWKKTFD